MNTIFGIKLHKAQVVMQLNISKSDEKRTANKIMQRKPVISIQYFISADPTDDAAVIILKDKTPVKKIIGKWEYHHTVDEGIFYTNYFRFTPVCDVKFCRLETVDIDTDEHYLYYTFNE
jgi:hypothetical protein